MTNYIKKQEERGINILKEKDRNRYQYKKFKKYYIEYSKDKRKKILYRYGIISQEYLKYIHQ